MDNTEQTTQEGTVTAKDNLDVFKTEEQKQFELYQQTIFHKTAVTEVKKLLGNSCTFLSHLKTKGGIWFLAHLNLNGSKRVIRIDSGKTKAEDLTPETYKALKDQLAEYVTGKKSI